VHKRLHGYGVLGIEFRKIKTIEFSRINTKVSQRVESGDVTP
tara:strand:+ start:248 stop:373 length:126 start_codon:yes stop_codon:yes gene_type:complete